MGWTGRKRLLERFASCCFTALPSLSPLEAMFWYSGAARAVERQPCWERHRADSCLGLVSGPRLWSHRCPRCHWRIKGLLNCDTCPPESLGSFFELLAVFVEFSCFASVVCLAALVFSLISHLNSVRGHLVFDATSHCRWISQKFQNVHLASLPSKVFRAPPYECVRPILFPVK